MSWANILRRWSAKSIHAMILGAALLGPASMAVAQTYNPVAAKLPDVSYTNAKSFGLPVRMTPDQRLNVSAVQLYSKTPTTSWKKQEDGAPSIERFNCRMPTDGEYWYSLVTVDRDGRMTPDLNETAPMLRVMVDTTPPVIQVQTIPGPDGAHTLRCTMDDANPDYATLKAICKTDRGDVALEPVPNQQGWFRLGSEMARFPVVVSGLDRAKNAGMQQVDVQTRTSNVAPPPVRKTEDIKLMSTTPLPGAPAATLPSPRWSDPPALPNPELPVNGGTLPKVELPMKVEQPTIPGGHIDLPAPSGLSMNSGLPGTTPDTQAKLPTDAARGSTPYRLINTTHATVEYRIDHFGPSGVSKVEIYQSPNQGQTWHRLCEDPSKRGPAEINLPGDGVYGIRIVITNGNGFGGHAPAPGDAPHCLIEVDTTAPFVQLRSAEVMPASGHVEIRWNAQDKNLDAAPVNIFYSTNVKGNWQVVARGLKNDGVHRWAFPKEISSQVYFKVEVADKAGNVSHDVSSQPVTIDMMEPHATVVGVSGSGVVRPGNP
jgi:hypothetical protein